MKKVLNVGQVLSMDGRLLHRSQSLSKRPVDLMLSYAHRMSWESSLISLPLEAKSWPSSSWSNKDSIGVGDLHADLPLQEYVYDPFEEIDASSIVTSWKDIKCVCSSVEFDGVSKDLMKLLSLLFQRCYLYARLTLEIMFMKHHLLFWIVFNRDIYIVLKDYLKDRLEYNTRTNDTPTFDEILEMIRVWILQIV